MFAVRVSFGSCAQGISNFLNPSQAVTKTQKPVFEPPCAKPVSDHEFDFLDDETLCQLDAGFDLEFNVQASQTIVSHSPPKPLAKQPLNASQNQIFHAKPFTKSPDVSRVDSLNHSNSRDFPVEDQTRGESVAQLFPDQTNVLAEDKLLEPRKIPGPAGKLPSLVSVFSKFISFEKDETGKRTIIQDARIIHVTGKTEARA